MIQRLALIGRIYTVDDEVAIQNEPPFEIDWPNTVEQRASNMLAPNWRNYWFLHQKNKSHQEDGSKI